MSPPTSFEIITSNLVWGIINAVEFDLTDRFMIPYIVLKIYQAEIEKRYFILCLSKLNAKRTRFLQATN